VIWLRTLLFALTFVAAVLVYVPRWILGPEGRARAAAGPARYGAGVLIGAGALLMVWCWYEFAARGRGTPMPLDPPRRLVIAGPYRYVRNPMYVAGLLLLLGQAVFYGAPSLVWYAAAFAVATHLFVVAYEEPALRRQFGAEYDAYRAAVRRWLPRLRPYEQDTPPAGAKE
jgi:protein-S-isoprenylcysteine O-methyltransferase Ste14